MVKHNKRVITIPKFYEAEPGDSNQVIWLCNILNVYNLNCSKVANMLHVTKQTVNNWLHDKSRMSYANVCTLFKALEINGDPDEIYQSMREPKNELFDEKVYNV